MKKLKLQKLCDPTYIHRGVCDPAGIQTRSVQLQSLYSSPSLHSLPEAEKQKHMLQQLMGWKLKLANHSLSSLSSHHLCGPNPEPPGGRKEFLHPLSSQSPPPPAQSHHITPPLCLGRGKGQNQARRSCSRCEGWGRARFRPPWRPRLQAWRRKVKGRAKLNQLLDTLTKFLYW